MNDYSEYIGKHFLISPEYCYICKDFYENNMLYKFLPFCGEIESIEIDKNLTVSFDEYIKVIYRHNPPYREKDSFIIRRSKFIDHCIIGNSEDEVFTTYRLFLEVN